MAIPEGQHDLGCQCWPHHSGSEVAELRRDRDAWREVALALADLHHRVAKALVEQKQVIRLDGPSLGAATRTAMLTYDRRNPGRIR